MSKGDARSRKAEYFTKLENLLQTYDKAFIVNVDNVGSNQMQQIRIGLRGSSIVLMGKNTMVRKVIRQQMENNPNLAKLLPHIKGNVGFVFTKGDLKETRSKLLSNRVAAPARAGAVAPQDVTVPAGNTGMDPGKTAFFQAIGIPTKIARGTIEIVTDVLLVKTGDKVGPSEATLLNMLKISPFTYGLTINQVYDNGAVFAPEILDISDDVIEEKILSGIKSIAALSLAIGYPTLASIPHSIVNAYKNLLAIAVATDISFELAEKIKAILSDPAAFAAAQAAAAASSAPSASAGSAAAAKEAPKVEEKAPEKEESDDDMGFGLFD